MSMSRDDSVADSGATRPEGAAPSASASSVASVAPVVIRDLTFRYGQEEILKHLSLTVNAHDFLAIIGPNGSGKTTLVRLMLGLLNPPPGTVQLFGEDIRRFRDWNRIGYVPQKYAVEKNFPGTVGELLALRKQPPSARTLELLDVGDLRKRMFLELSGGQQQRVLMALALQSNPALLILDEPTVGVDLKALQNFYRLLERLNREEGVAILLITHDVGPITRYAQHVLCINCTVFSHGPASQTHELLRNVYGPDFDLDHAHHSHHHDHGHDQAHPRRGDDETRKNDPQAGAPGAA